MDADSLNQIVGLVGGGILALMTWVGISKRERQLDDPNDNSVVYLEQLQALTALQQGGKYLLRVKRQSGNLQKDDQIFDSPSAAISAAITTFKRAKIDYVFVEKNTEVEFWFRRPYHHHGGKAEGKKVGSVEIYKVE